MKKVNYLFALIATVFVLGMTSCDTSNDPQPDPAVDGLTLSDFDGIWNTVSTTYNQQSYDADVVCDELRSISWQNLTLNVNSSTEIIVFTDVCRSFDRNWRVEFDADTQVITVTGSFDQKYKIHEYDFNTTPNTMAIEIISNGDANSMPEGVTYVMAKQ